MDNPAVDGPAVASTSSSAEGPAVPSPSTGGMGGSADDPAVSPLSNGGADDASVEDEVLGKTSSSALSSSENSF